MREILFKAKRIDNGEWVEGYYLRDQYHRGGKDIIFYRKDSDWFTVYTDIIDPETLCQFTGLCDRYGNKIWENDILKTWDDQYVQVKFGLYSTGFASDDCNQGFYVEFPESSIYRHELGYWCKKTYTRGNIFDNPELLQEKANE